MLTQRPNACCGGISKNDFRDFVWIKRNEKVANADQKYASQQCVTPISMRMKRAGVGIRGMERERRDICRM